MLMLIIIIIINNIAARLRCVCNGTTHIMSFIVYILGSS